jgi:hypothetical protein
VSTITISILICLAAFGALIWLLRRDRMSLGLPVAYLFGLLLIHVPGAAAELVAGDRLGDADYTALGIRFTAIAALCFLAGVYLARRSRVPLPKPREVDHQRFSVFCLFGGWILIYGLSPIAKIPSIGAAIEAGGAIWTLGVMLALRDAVRRGEPGSIVTWLCALGVYPTLMLLLGGFLSYGSAAAIAVLSILTISVRSPRRLALGIVVFSFIGLTVFVNWFAHRDDIRDSVWHDDPMSQRVAVVSDAMQGFHWFDLWDPIQQNALDQRLNQNYFEGLAATRLQEGRVNYLYGESLWDGVLGLIPRIIWPDKPVIAGSPEIVSEMTGLVLDPNTSFGVGNVMEFQINFGTPGIVVGFLALGWALGLLDRKAAAAEQAGDLGRLFIVFLAGMALIDPSGSLVEVGEGLAAAMVAGYGWRWAWYEWLNHFPSVPSSARQRVPPVRRRQVWTPRQGEDLSRRY